MVKNKFERKPKVIRSDRGGEYLNKIVFDFLKSQGIQSQLTALYSPQQNGTAKRKNRTLIKMVRSMLLEGFTIYGMFWGEAVMTANYIQNRTITKTVDQTPLELWTGH